MTKKATWSGYRGDGKPVVPCIPECLIERKSVNHSGRAIKSPTDYRKRSRQVSAAPRKELKRLRNKIFLHGHPRKFSITYDSHLRSYSNRLKVVQKALETGDLDLMRVYEAFYPDYSLDHIEAVALIFRDMGFATVQEKITATQIETYSGISNRVILFMMSTSETFGFEKAAQEIREISKLAFSGKDEEAAVNAVIADRGIGNVVEVRKLVDEILVGSITLGSGIL